MNLKKIVLKSGVTIDLSEAGDTKIIPREEVKIKYKGYNVGEETRWDEVPTKEIVSILRVIKGDSIWEIREDQIAAFEYLDKSKNEIKI